MCTIHLYVREICACRGLFFFFCALAPLQRFCQDANLCLALDQTRVWVLAGAGASDPWNCTIMVNPTGKGGAPGPGDGAVSPFAGFAKDAKRKDFPVM